MGMSAGVLGIGLLLLLLLSGMPIAFALFLTGIVGIGALVGFGKAISLCSTIPMESVSIYTLTAIPAFIAMGTLARRAAITDNFFEAAGKWFSSLKGGLATASVVAAGAFAAVTGSSVASASALAPLCIPDMVSKKYSKKLAAGSVAAGNMLGIMIPPSITMVIYGQITGASVGKCLIAGTIPGFLSILVFGATIALWVLLSPDSAPPSEKSRFSEKLFSIVRTWRLWTIVVIIFGGIYSGFFTPTEAGACGAVFCLAFCFIGMKSQNLKAHIIDVAKAFKEAAVMSSMIFAIMIGAKFFDQFLVLSGFPSELAAWVTHSGFSKYLVLWIILLAYIPLGMLLDGASMILITVPIYLPVFQFFGFNLVYIAVLVTAMVELGLITPPMGLNAFVIKGVMPELSLERDIFGGCLPFIGSQLVVVTILVYFPIISLFLPKLM